MNVISTENVPIKLWLDDIEDGALQQAKNLANLPFVYKWISIMPDSHQGYGMPIGGVMATKGVIVPNAVGVDIGCGMSAIKTSLTALSQEELFFLVDGIKQDIPVGFNHRHTMQYWNGFDSAPDIPIIQQELENAKYQLGTLGGGNHFIEIQKGSDGYIWLMIHSGSRNFGFKTANEYHRKAQWLCDKWHSEIPDRDLSFLPIESKEGEEYFTAMNYCMEFAKANRAHMVSRIMTVFEECVDFDVLERIDIHHNYAAFENHYGENVLVHRKGATKATVGMVGIIPGSMGTSSYITEGLGNPESFMSSSHGAGRRMGRKEAEHTLDLIEEQKKMAGIVHGLNSSKNLDESPGAYKDIDTVMDNQKDLVKILVSLKPLASIKG